MIDNNKIMIIAGEASGDLHGSNLVHEMLALESNLKFCGIGGDRMKAEGVELMVHINDMSVLGFGDVIRRFPFFRRVYRTLVKRLKSDIPRMLILIDYPGLNLKLAKAAKKIGIKVFYYIAPQVWAWGAGRMDNMAKYIDKLAAIIPFEENLFRDAGIDARFVGHPLLDLASSKSTKLEFLEKHHLKAKVNIIGLLPGSRTHEVERLLPEMIIIFNELSKKHLGIQGLVACTSTVNENVYNSLMKDAVGITQVYEETYDVMKHSDLLIVASGTATLEAALFETPLIIVYRVDPLSFFLGKRLVKVRNIGLVNVIAGNEIVPEFIQKDFSSEKVIPAAEKLLYNTVLREKTINHLKGIRQRLGKPGAAKRAANIALSI